jgi:DNA invertase Pin-like site-specific DNA recombinase
MPRHSITETPPVAYSYLRFSSLEQAKGDSLRRQKERRDVWLSRNRATLDTALRLEDAGVSAMTGKHRENPDRHALARFLQLIQSGRVPRGSYLLIENLDRLSREEEVPACHLLTGILMAGVKVVQLSPYEMELTEKSNGWELMRAVMELSRGHSESALKSERVGAARANERRRIREKHEVVTHQLPGWIEEREGKASLIPERAAAVKRIFALAAGGYGVPAIMRKLTEEGVRPFGECERYVDDWGRPRARSVKGRRFGSGRWTRPYVQLILKDRRAVGEYQPRGREGQPDGDVIRGFYPAAVTEDEWARARAGAAERRKFPGRVSVRNEVNVFAGLLKHARDGDAYMMTKRLSRSPGRPSRAYSVLVNAKGDDGRARAYGLPYLVFERAVLQALKEIDPHEILNGDHPPDETAVLGAQLASAESELAEASAFMRKRGFSAAIGEQVAALESRITALNKLLAEARQRAAHPLSETWGEFRGLAESLYSAPDPHDARRRLRSALRRVVESALLLIVPMGSGRLAAVQFCFAGGRSRSYVIYHQPKRAPGGVVKEERWWVQSLEDAGVDLRRVADLAALEGMLAGIDVASGPGGAAAS